MKDKTKYSVSGIGRRGGRITYPLYVSRKAAEREAKRWRVAGMRGVLIRKIA